MTGCEFNATITRTELGWALEIQDPSHNHPAFLAPAALPQNRKRSDDTTKTIRDITSSSIGAAKILTNLLKKDITIDLQDIYNERRVYRKEQLGGLTSIQALLRALEQYGGDDLTAKYYFAHEEDDRDRVKYLFFAHIELLKFFKLNPNTLLLNYTYKTNKFKMPFLYIVGVSNTN